mgnify:CR=1 FL=1
MSKKILVIAPHPDDETLGCGGTILKHISDGDTVYWLIITAISVESGYKQEHIKKRKKEIAAVNKLYGFKDLFELNYPPSELDDFPVKNLIDSFSKIIGKVKPHTIYIPYFGDIHSDHRVVCDVALSCVKSFRINYVKKIICYETISETEFNLKGSDYSFNPNLWINIEKFLNKKIKIFKIYESEISKHPFPRSEKNLHSLASIRGSNVGLKSAESFMILKDIS